VGIQEFGNLGIRECWNLGICELGNFGMRECGSLESWEIGEGIFSGKIFSRVFDVAFSLILSKRLW